MLCGVTCSQAPGVRMWASWGANTLLTVESGQERQTGTCAVLESRCENRLCGGARVSFVSGCVPHFPRLSHAEKSYLPLSRSPLPFTTDHRRWFWMGQWLLGMLTLFPTLRRSPLPCETAVPASALRQHHSPQWRGVALTSFCPALHDGGHCGSEVTGHSRLSPSSLPDRLRTWAGLSGSLADQLGRGLRFLRG